MSGSATAATRNVPDAIHLKVMEAQRMEMMSVIAEAKTAADTKEAAENCEVLSTMWCDPSRTDDTATGGLGCWGDNITDVRLESRRFKLDPSSGEKLPGTETGWTLCQILQTSSNMADTRTDIDAAQFKLIVADDDGSNKRSKTLKEVTSNLKRFFPSEGLEQPQTRVDRVAVAHRMAFVPVPSADKGWGTEVRYVCYGYNTMSHADPKNLLLFADTMNTSVFAEEPGYAVGFQPLYTKLMSTVCPETGGANAEKKMRCYATAVEATDRSIKDIGTETAAQSAAAAAAGKGTQVRTGPVTLVGTSSCAWHIAIPLQPQRPPTPEPVAGVAVGTDGLGRPMGPGGPVYRSLGADPGDDVADLMDDDAAEAFRSGGGLVKVEAKEGRIGLGTYVEDAKPLAVASPVAKPSPAIATAIYIMTIPMGTVPSKETVIDACKELKKRHRQTNECGGSIHVESRIGCQAAVEAGLTTEGPLSKKAKAEIAATVGPKLMDMVTPGSEALAPTISVGRPLLAGVPAE